MPALWEEPLEVLDVAEVNWGASTILAIFFAASLVSAVFFGLGYTFGRGGTPGPGSSISFRRMSTPAIASTSNQSTAHPNAAIALVHAQETAVAPRDSAMPVHPVAAPASVTRPVATHVVERTAKPAAKANPKIATLRAGSARYMVQVGAIGDQKDARALVSLLRKKGFHAGIYPGKHDKFLHVQIGPFATEEQAKTMRYHVTASGYRAILKHAS